MYYVIITKGYERIIDGKANWVEYLKNFKNHTCKKIKDRTDAEDMLNKILENNNRNELLNEIEHLKPEEKKLMCFYDSEFNAFDYNNGLPQEVISVGLVIVNSAGNLIDSYYSGIKMKAAPKLSNRCKKITGLTDKEIENSPSFITVCSEIDAFLKKYDINHVFTLGSEDLKQFSATSDIYIRTKAMKRIETKFINIRRQFRKIANQEISDMGLKYLKQICGMDSNVIHNALSDAKDLADVYYKLNTVGYSEDTLQKILEDRKKDKLYSKSRNIEDKKIYAPDDIIKAKDVLVSYLRTINNVSIDPIILKTMADDLDNLLIATKKA